MRELAARDGVEFTAEGDPPEHYEICFSTPGVALDAEHRPAPRSLHRVGIYLHADYPRLPPQLVWKTPIFHPNILPPERHGGVCIGRWAASESVADLCERLMRMVRFETFNIDDPLNPEAAAWARDLGLREGEDPLADQRAVEPVDIVVTTTGT